MITSKLCRANKFLRIALSNIDSSSARCVSVHSSISNKIQVEEKSAWKDAEKVVGYPTSFLNLRWLLNDEFANVATQLNKIIGSDHPLLSVAKGFLCKNEMLDWGLIVLLISKAGGCKLHTIEMEYDRTAGILHTQRVLAEITEMIRTGILIHKGLLNVDSTSEDANDMHYGNKVALLVGDYLLSKSFSDIASLRNCAVNELISLGLKDLTETAFITPSDKQNHPLPAEPNTTLKTPPSDVFDENSLDFGPYKVSEILGNSRDEWFMRHLLGGAKLLGLSCKGALILAGYDSDFSLHGYLFGKHVGLALQAKLDYDLFSAKKFNNSTLVSAPIMLHLCKEPALYEDIKKGLDDVRNCDFNKIWKIVCDGSALDDTKQLQYQLQQRAIKNLQHFHDSDAKTALTNIINAM